MAILQLNQGYLNDKTQMTENSSAFLFIDVDGYHPTSARCSQQHIASSSRDGYRPRELGWIIFTPKYYASGAFYFTDVGIPGLSPLSVHDPAVRYVWAKIHGLPINHYQKPVAKDCLFRSDQLLDVIAGLCVAAGEGGHEVTVVHKGGNEGHWTRVARPGTPILDLADFGCPKVDRIAKEHLDWLAAAPAPCRHHETIVRSEQTTSTTHCPVLELALLARWIAESMLSSQ